MGRWKSEGAAAKKRARKGRKRRKNLANMTKFPVQQQLDCCTSGVHQQIGKSYKKERGIEWKGGREREGPG